MDNKARLKLTGGPEKTVTWVWLDNEQLKIEYYDFSPLAQHMFGNDIAYTLSIEQNDMSRLYSLSGQDARSLLDWISKTFHNYFEIKQWFDENKIQYSKDIESWA